MCIRPIYCEMPRKEGEENKISIIIGMSMIKYDVIALPLLLFKQTCIMENFASSILNLELVAKNLFEIELFSSFANT